MLKDGKGVDVDSLIEIALAKVPETDLIKVVQAEAPSNAVEENGIGNGDGNDFGDVEAEEVDVCENGPDIGVAYEDKDEEDDGDQVTGGGDDNAVSSRGPGHG